MILVALMRLGKRDDDLVALASAQSAERLIDDDSRQPSRYLRITVKLVDMTVRVDIGFL